MTKYAICSKWVEAFSGVAALAIIVALMLVAGTALLSAAYFYAAAAANAADPVAVSSLLDSQMPVWSAS